MGTHTTMPCPSLEVRRRVDLVVAHLYPRLLVQAARIVGNRRGGELEAGDLSQDGMLAAIRYLYSIPRSRFDGLNNQAVLAIFYVVATKAMRGKFVDHLRRNDRQRHLQHLVAPPDDIDRASAAQQDARVCVLSLYSHASGAGRAILKAALEFGELDVTMIAAHSGLSRAYVYRVLQNLAAGANT
jgi:DNA-directed RNA polymerase specialized sigma24 family protein